MNERSGDAYENKGSAVHGRPQSGNVTENKGSYASKVGILLKIHGLGGRCQTVDGKSQEVGGGRTGFTIQDSGFRSQNEEHLLSADCLLLTADCLLRLRGVRVGGTVGVRRSLRQDVTADSGRKNS